MKKYFLVKISFYFLTLSMFSTVQTCAQAVQPIAIHQLVAKSALKHPDRFDLLVVLLLRLKQSKKITSQQLTELQDDLISAITLDRKDFRNLLQNLEHLLNAPIEAHYESNEFLRPLPKQPEKPPVHKGKNKIA